MQRFFTEKLLNLVLLKLLIERDVIAEGPVCHSVYGEARVTKFKLSAAHNHMFCYTSICSALMKRFVKFRSSTLYSSLFEGMQLAVQFSGYISLCDEKTAMSNEPLKVTLSPEDIPGVIVSKQYEKQINAPASWRKRVITNRLDFLHRISKSMVVLSM